MEDAVVARAVLDRFGLGDAVQVPDPEKRLYRAFGLGRATLRAILAPQTILRGLLLVLTGRRPVPYDGDKHQLPGAFLVHEGQVLATHRYATIADLPDLAGIAAAAPPYRVRDG